MPDHSGTADSQAALLRIAGRVARMGGWTIDLPDRILTWSDETCAIHDLPPGYTPTLDEGLSYFLPEHREEVVRYVEACAHEGTPYDFEFPKVTARGRAIWVRSIGEAVRDADGRIIRIQGAFQDITERRQADQQLRDQRAELEQQHLRAQRLESIGTLAGGIAHDLNNVLAPILLSIDLLRTDDDDEDRRELLDTVEASATRGAEMVGRVLAFARGVEGRKRTVHVPRLLGELASILTDTLPKSIRVESHVSDDVLTTHADPTQLHQVLVNLCVNARDAMPDGGLLTITADNVFFTEADVARNIEAQVGPYVRLRVEDSGTGIPAAIIDRIFDPFFTTKEVGKGTGLGLPTSAAIIRRHGGFLRVATKAGEGTCFSVYLPAQDAPVHAPEPVIPEVVNHHPKGNGETVLVVDDEPQIRLMTSRILEHHGYRVLVAADGAEAVAIYAARPHDIALVLTDMMMPVMDGLATMQALRRINPNLPIVGSSGNAPEEIKAQAQREGTRHFLGKPYTADALLLTVRAALDR